MVWQNLPPRWAGPGNGWTAARGTAAKAMSAGAGGGGEREGVVGVGWGTEEEMRRSEALLRGRQTGQSPSVQFFQ